MGIPLKLEGGSGDLKQLTLAEEDYCAYALGLQFAAAGTTNSGFVNTTSSYDSIGTFSDTFYNQAVGTHPGTSLTIGQTDYTLYQNLGASSQTGTDFYRPIEWDGTLDGIQEMDDTAFNVFTDRILSKVMANEYIGVLRLASAAPSGDWSVYISNVFTDTQADGTTVNYSLYRRTSMTVPTAVETCRIRRSGGQTGTFEGVQEMTLAQMQYTFGQRAKQRVGESGIGQYQIRTSGQGAPVDPGTWVARGTATDTRKTTADTAYTANYTRNSTSTSTGNYVGDFTGNYTGNYIWDCTYTRNSQVAYAGDYTGNYLGNYVRDVNYVGNYVRAVAYGGVYQFQLNYTQYASFQSVLLNFNGPYQWAGIGSYNGFSGPKQFAGYVGWAAYRYYAGTRSWQGNYVGSRTTFVPVDFLGDYVRAVDFTANYTRNSVGNYTGDYLGNYLLEITYTGDYIRNSTSTYTGNYVGDFTGNYLGNYAGETIQAGASTIETYTLYCRTA